MLSIQFSTQSTCSTLALACTLYNAHTVQSKFLCNEFRSNNERKQIDNRLFSVDSLFLHIFTSISYPRNHKPQSKIKGNISGFKKSFDFPQNIFCSYTRLIWPHFFMYANTFAIYCIACMVHTFQMQPKQTKHLWTYQPN